MQHDPIAPSVIISNVLDLCEVLAEWSIPAYRVEALRDAQGGKLWESYIPLERKDVISLCAALEALDDDRLPIGITAHHLIQARAESADLQQLLNAMTDQVEIPPHRFAVLIHCLYALAIQIEVDEALSR